jgi:hypothetical protein
MSTSLSSAFVARMLRLHDLPVQLGHLPGDIRKFFPGVKPAEHAFLEGVLGTITDDGLAQRLVQQRIAQNLVDAGEVLVVDVDLVAKESAEGERF